MEVGEVMIDRSFVHPTAVREGLTLELQRMQMVAQGSWTVRIGGEPCRLVLKSYAWIVG